MVSGFRRGGDRPVSAVARDAERHAITCPEPPAADGRLGENETGIAYQLTGRHGTYSYRATWPGKPTSKC
jgi:hypothetical protein